jgi:hypothetical protein
VAKQVREPTAVIGISLVTTPVLDIIGIGQHDFNAVLQNVKDRFPVRTSALHYGMAAPFPDEPIAKKLQFGDDGSEFSNLGLWLGLQRPGHDANNEKLLAYVYTRATLDDCFNHFVSSRASSQRKKDPVVPRAQSSSQRFVIVGRIRLMLGVSPPLRKRSLPVRTPIFILRDGRTSAAIDEINDA